MSWNAPTSKIVLQSVGAFNECKPSDQEFDDEIASINSKDNDDDADDDDD